MRQPLLLVAITALSACTSAPSEQQLRAKFPDGAVLAAFEIQSPPGYDDFMDCYEIDKHDPPDQVLAVLLERSRAAPASHCTYVVGESGSFHNKTKRKAIFHRLSGLRLTSDTTAVANVSSFHHGLWGSFGRIEFAKKDGRWQVVSYRPTGVS